MKIENMDRAVTIIQNMKIMLRHKEELERGSILTWLNNIDEIYHHLSERHKETIIKMFCLCVEEQIEEYRKQIEEL